MSFALSVDDLADLEKIRQLIARCDRPKKFAPLGLGEVHLTDDLFGLLPKIIEQQLRKKGLNASKQTHIKLIVDPVVIRRDGRDVKSEIMALLGSFYQVERVTLDDGHPILHADEAILAMATQAAIGADCLISLGGGTITDIAKFAAHQANVGLHIVIQTAASVDGYTDNFSVVLQNGVKTTLTTRWPEVVIADNRIIAEAPHHLNAAGFGELMSMYCAPGDWFLAAKLGMDENYIPLLLDFLEPCGEGLENWAAGLGKGEKHACARLTAALDLRGIVTGISGTTAPLSGMEHLFSHMLDMLHGARHEPMGLHGQQVGVGALIRAGAWAFFCEKMKTATLDPARLFPEISSFEPQVRGAFAGLDPSGRIGEECWSRYRKKFELWHQRREQVVNFFQNWEQHRQQHDSLTRSVETIAHYMRQAQAAMHYSALTPSLSREHLHFVVANCQFMRERFTIADLLTWAGWWHETQVMQLLTQVDRICQNMPEGTI